MIWLIPLGVAAWFALKPRATIQRAAPQQIMKPPLSLDQFIRGVTQVFTKPTPSAAPHVPTSSAAQRPSFSVRSLLDLIARGEANRGYDSYYTGARIRPEIPVSRMSVAQVRDWQERNRRAGSVSTAVGRYQFISSTLAGLLSELRIPSSAVFNAALQDQLATRLLIRRGLNSFLTGALSPAQFALNLSREWASLPKDASNLSYYHGQAGNVARVAFNDVISTLTGQG